MLTIYTTNGGINFEHDWGIGPDMVGLLNFPTFDAAQVYQVYATDKELALILNAFRVGTSQTLPYPPEVAKERGYMNWYGDLARLIVETLQYQIEMEKPALMERLGDAKTQRDIALMNQRREVQGKTVDMPKVRQSRREKRQALSDALKRAKVLEYKQNEGKR